MSNDISSEKSIIEKVAKDVADIKLPLGGEFVRHFIVHERGAGVSYKILLILLESLSYSQKNTFYRLHGFLM